MLGVSAHELELRFEARSLVGKLALFPRMASLLDVDLAVGRDPVQSGSVARKERRNLLLSVAWPSWL